MAGTLNQSIASGGPLSALTSGGIGCGNAGPLSPVVGIANTVTQVAYTLGTEIGVALLVIGGLLILLPIGFDERGKRLFKHTLIGLGVLLASKRVLPLLTDILNTSLC
ncbi:MAG: hypothetical protein SV186_03960 [Candidatus Nanohaloarchaea archaeon]|nr:hypothetical protein [Candidatus Nanohaloarchaea archaeon]